MLGAHAPKPLEERHYHAKGPVVKRPLPKPDFFILGAGKSATTSLYYYLRQHPEVCMSRDKEPTFLCNLFQRVSDPISYLGLFKTTERTKRIGEASHAYLTCSGTAAAIRTLFPEARFIVIFRNPVDRAFSLYHYMARMGDEWAPSFERGLREEERRVRDPKFGRDNPQYFHNYMYFRSGLYSTQVERYLRFFHRDRFLFLTVDGLMHDGLKTIQRVYEFLEVDSSIVPKMKRHNEGASVQSPRLQFFYKQRLARGLRLLRGVPILCQLGHWGEQAVERLMQRNVRPLPRAMRPETRRDLEARYADDLRRLERLTGLDLSAWIAGRRERSEEAGNRSALTAA
jgi:hypothetical protein